MNTKGIPTTDAIAVELGLTAGKTSRALRELERDEFAVEEYDESLNVSADFNRQRWRLTARGIEELYALEDGEHGRLA